MTRTGIGLAVLTMAFIGVWCEGCQEEQKTAPAGNAGLNQQTSLENTQLKTETENLKKQIEDLKKQTEQQKQQIAQYDQKNQQMTAKFEQEKAAKEPCIQEKQQLAKCEEEKQQSVKCEKEKQQLAECEEEKQKAEKRYNDELSALTKKNSELTAEIERQKAELATLKGEITAKPRHLGMVALVMVGVVTVLGVIIAAIIETGRMDKAKASILPRAPETPADKKKG